MKPKSRTLIALAVAGSFACASAFAGGSHHAGYTSGQSDTQMRAAEIHTPSSVDESAPWLTGQSHLAGWSAPMSRSTIGFQEGQFSDGPVGTSSGMSGTGTGGFDSSTGTSQDWSTTIPDNSSMNHSDDSSMNGGYDWSLSDSGTMGSGDDYALVDYWLIGDDGHSGTGASSSVGGAGSGGFDSSMSSSDATDTDSMSMGDSGYDDYALDSGSGPDQILSTVYTPSAEWVADTVGDATPLLSEHYLVYGPLASFDPQNMIVLETGPAPEDVALLDSLSHDFYVLTPAYDEG